LVTWIRRQPAVWLVEQLEHDGGREPGISLADLGPEGEESHVVCIRVDTHLVVVVHVDDDLELAFEGSGDDSIDLGEERRRDLEWSGLCRMLRPSHRQADGVEPGVPDHAEISGVDGPRTRHIGAHVERVAEVDAATHDLTPYERMPA
jgi:hypothetical protein